MFKISDFHIDISNIVLFNDRSRPYEDLVDKALEGMLNGINHRHNHNFESEERKSDILKAKEISDRYWERIVKNL